MLDRQVERRGASAKQGQVPPSRWSALPSVLGDLAGHSRAIVTYLRSGDPALAAHLRRSLIGDPDAAAAVPSDLLGSLWQPILPPGPKPLILIPVFNAFHHLDRLLDKLPNSLGSCPHHVLLVDDGSDDLRVAQRLAAFIADFPDTTTLIRLPENLGFVGAVNTGLRHARDLTAGHVVLLNSDTIPPDGWLPRLLTPLIGSPTIASVTPLSNTAEVVSTPAQDAASDITENTVARMDSVAQRLRPPYRTVEIPTGIGFCMAMNRRFLDKLDDFDTAFGRGYGEEVDWCQKARAIGGTHVVNAGVFVGHSGSASFGAAERSLRQSEATAEIARRYPTYDREVRTWALSAPLGAQRLALSVGWAAAVTKGPVPIYLAHTFGGGAEIALMKEIQHRQSTNGVSVVIRVGGAARWRIELIGPGVHRQGDIDDAETLDMLLAPLTARDVIYSCGVGGDDPRDVPRLLERLTRSGDRLSIRFHDHFPISPSCFLLNSKGHYRGVPDIGTDDPAHAITNRMGERLGTHRDWRDMWGNVLNRASLVEVYSNATARLVRTAYPAAGEKITVVPHNIDRLPDSLQPGGRAIGVLGGINTPKGAGVLAALARHYRQARSEQNIVVIGELDGTYRLPRPHRVHGRYDAEDIAALARRYDIGLWLMPSICPETFSFTVREMLATGLPVLTFDLGAQAEAARLAPNGHVLTTSPDDTPALARAIENAFPTHH